LTMESLVEAMNKALGDDMKDVLEFYYNDQKQRLYVFSRKAEGHVIFKKDTDSTLANILGIPEFNTNLPIEGHSTYIAKYKADLKIGNSSVYIYTNIVHPQHVGDTLAPLLRVIPVTNTNSGQIHQVYNTPYYIPVSRMHIDTIEIDLRTDTGDRIVFEAGKVMCKLHFRQVLH
jgi:hypothetical protein